MSLSLNLKSKSLAEKVVNILLDILIGIFGVILVIALYNAIQIKVLKNSYASFFGYSVFEVQTGSMTPVINPGDWIIVKNKSDYKLGDIVTYQSDGEFITHSIIEVYKGTYVTKGEANSGKDAPISKDQIVGKKEVILPYFGIFRKTIFNPIVLIALIATLYLFSYTFKKSKNDSVVELESPNPLDENNNKMEDIKHFFIDVKDAITEKVAEVKENIASSKSSKDQESRKVNLGGNISKAGNSSSGNAIAKDAALTSDINNGVIPDADEVLAKMEAATKEGKNNLEEEVNDDLDKTMCFRMISVDKAEIDDTFMEVAQNEVKEAEKETKKKGKKQKEAVEVVDDATEDETDKVAKSNLELLFKNKKSKNIIEKVMFLKNEELKQIIDVLNNNEKPKVNEISIRNSFSATYIEARYYGNFAMKLKDLQTKNLITKLDANINYVADSLIKAYKGSDIKYEEKVNYNRNLMLAFNQIDNVKDSVTDINAKREFYKKKIKKNVQYEEEVLANVVNAVIKVQKSFVGMINYSLKKLETNVFNITINQLGTKKGIYGVKLEHNISFSKVYSDYIVDKTYTEGVIAEDKINVLLTLLQGELVKDMLNNDFTKKYVVNIPRTLYEKTNKFDKTLRMINDEFAKGKVLLLIAYEDLVLNKKLVKATRKLGYSFGLMFNNDVEIKDKDKACINSCDHVFINKKATKNSNIISNIPEDLSAKITYDNVYEKIGDFGGE